MSRSPRRPHPAPPPDRLDEEPPPPRPQPRAWPPGAPVPIGDRQHRPRRLALALSQASGLALVAGVTAALLLISPLGTRADAREHAARDLATLLEPGEEILAQTEVSQRRAADVWRRSFGVLVVTTHRVMHVGTAPLPVLRPTDPGPRDVLLHSWTHEGIRSVDTDAPARMGVLLVRTPERSTRFHADDARGALEVLRAATVARQRQRDSTRPMNTTAGPY